MSSSMNNTDDMNVVDDVVDVDYTYNCINDNAQDVACSQTCTSLAACQTCDCVVVETETVSGPWGDFMDVFFCLAPILFLIVVTVKPRPWPTTTSLPVSAFFMFLVRTAYLGLDPLLTAGAVLLGLLEAMTPLSIMAGAMFLFESMEATGCMPYMMRELQCLTAGHAVANLMLIFAFGYMVEGASGFGTPVALAAPMLVRTGQPALESVIVLLLFNTFSTVWGAVGTPLWFGLGGTLADSADPEQDLIDISTKAAIALAIPALIVIPILLKKTLVPWTVVRANVGFIYASLLVTIGPSVAIACFNYEFPSLVGGLAGCTLVACLVKFRVGLRPMPTTADDAADADEKKDKNNDEISDDAADLKVSSLGAGVATTAVAVGDSGDAAAKGDDDDDQDTSTHPHSQPSDEEERGGEAENVKGGGDDEEQQQQQQQDRSNNHNKDSKNIENVYNDDLGEELVLGGSKDVEALSAAAAPSNEDKDVNHDKDQSSPVSEKPQEAEDTSTTRRSSPTTVAGSTIESVFHQDYEPVALGGATADADHPQEHSTSLAPRKTWAEGYLRESVLRTFPLWAVVLLLILTRVEAFGIKEYLTKREPYFSIYFGTLGTFRLSSSIVFQMLNIMTYPNLNWKYELLYVPFLIPFVLVSLLTMLLFRKDLTRRPTEIAATVMSRLQSPTVAMLGALSLVQLILKEGNAAPAYILGSILSDWFQEAFVVISPLLGALGSFFSGSTTVSNLTFGEIQNIAAESIGTSRTTMLALQAVGASAGNGICLNNIIAACAVVGLTGKVGEGQILIRTYKYVFTTTTIATAVMLAFFFRF